MGSHLWEQIEFPRKAKGGIGLTMIGTGPVFPRGCRHVMFVHDLNSLKYPEYFSKGYRTWSKIAKYGAIRRADRLIVFSDYVARDLESCLGVDRGKIRIIPQGVGNRALLVDVPIVERKDRRSFLCVGSLQPHKNLRRIIDAWALSGLSKMGAELRVVGKPQKNFTNDIGNSTSDGVRYLGYLSDQALADEYRNAVALVFPSLTEGFGLPVVEAFHAATPVITSNCSCLPEVAGDAGILVDPLSSPEIAEAMKEVFVNQKLFTDLQERAIRRKSLYSWAQAGESLSESLNSLL